MLQKPTRVQKRLRVASWTFPSKSPQRKSDSKPATRLDLSTTGVDGLREIVRDIVREELRKLLPTDNQPAALSIAEVVREEVQRAFQPEAPASVAAPEEPTLTYAAVARRPAPASRQYWTPPRRDAPAPQTFQRRDGQPQLVRTEQPAPRKTDVWRTADRRPLCYHCGEADHVYRSPDRLNRKAARWRRRSKPLNPVRPGANSRTHQHSDGQSGTPPLQNATTADRSAMCPDGGICPEGQSCGDVGDGRYACCPYSNADQGFSHPHVRGLSELQKDLAILKSLGVPAKSNRAKTIKFENCPDGTSCHYGSSCCQNEDGRYACCPYERAQCCDNERCCPRGFKCNDAEKTCTKDETVKPMAAKYRSFRNPVPNIDSRGADASKYQRSRRVCQWQVTREGGERAVHRGMRAPPSLPWQPGSAPRSGGTYGLPELGLDSWLNNHRHPAQPGSGIFPLPEGQWTPTDFRKLTLLARSGTHQEGRAWRVQPTLICPKATPRRHLLRR
ncbi:hypothetical protein HPB47_003363 [Ixodes persulcatus]|uniref:Uncharacterized protein n=1 Tax=Ixodes persulcatus TaxID=34615 RepID=A0AC60PIQ7_IXOPE|nr:hypothetical protein HPB47_003363 [Ixodes persulcatus]